MTWRFGETRNASAVMETADKRGRRPQRFCQGCGAGLIGTAQKWCKPCYSDVLTERARARYRSKNRERVPA